MKVSGYDATITSIEQTRIVGDMFGTKIEAVLKREDFEVLRCNTYSTLTETNSMVLDNEPVYVGDFDLLGHGLVGVTFIVARTVRRID